MVWEAYCTDMTPLPHQAVEPCCRKHTFLSSLLLF